MPLTAYRFITTGSSNLVDAVLVYSAVHNIKSMNLLGSAHMQLNARVLYHNLLNIEPEGDLPDHSRISGGLIRALMQSS